MGAGEVVNANPFSLVGMSWTWIYNLRSISGRGARRWFEAIFLSTVICLSAGCTKPGAGGMSSEPPEVLVTETLQQDVPVVREWIGSLDGSVDANVRARVSGYVISANYKGGPVVNKCSHLFQIERTFCEQA